MTSFFSKVETVPPDALFGVNALCQADDYPNKINLTVGAYRDDEGKPVVLNSVKGAEHSISNDETSNHEYLALGGLKSFTTLSAKLVFEDENGESPAVAAGRIHSIQCVGGTGALRLAFEFLKRVQPGAAIYIPSSTWPTHPKILQHAGVEFQTYRYLKQTSSQLSFDFDGMLEDLGHCPEGSVILLHMVAHNPSGFDPSEAQWLDILNVVQERKLLPFMDNAYQGFYRGLLQDAYPARLFANAGVEMLMACSYSKNFGLYGERVGCLHILSEDACAGTAILSNVVALSRTLCSNCPAHGAKIVATILSSPKLKELWVRECATMANRLNTVRTDLYNKLIDNNTPGNWEHIKSQGGMFSLTGISSQAIERLQSHHHIYMLSTGRISLAGLNTGNIERFVTAVKESINFVSQNDKHE